MSEHTRGVHMSPQQLTATKLTPNLLVSNVERSLTFYEDVLDSRAA